MQIPDEEAIREARAAAESRRQHLNALAKASRSARAALGSTPSTSGAATAGESQASQLRAPPSAATTADGTATTVLTPTTSKQNGDSPTGSPGPLRKQPSFFRASVDVDISGSLPFTPVSLVFNNLR